MTRTAARLSMPTPALPGRRTRPLSALGTPPTHAALLTPDALVDPGDRRGVIVGSGPACEVRVADRHVSKRHCRVARAGRGLRVVDLDSTNGVWLRGAPQRTCDVLPGDVVGLGRLRLPVVEAGISERFPGTVGFHGILARDPRSLAVLRMIARVADSDAPVWIRGDSGTGKEGVARAIHAASARGSGPFVALNCAALPENLAEGELFGVVRGAYTGADRDRLGAFQRAHGGTLLLDEIGELPAAAQAKLLRALEMGEVTPVGGQRAERVDVRVLAATWRDLKLDAADGRFRFDLLQRIHVLEVALAPLCERPGDVEPLLERFLVEGNRPDYWPTPQIVAMLRSAPWPGNVRELRNLVQRFTITGRDRTLTEVLAGRPELRRRGAKPAASLRERVLAALRLNEGNRAAAARALGISRSTLYRWLERTQLTPRSAPAGASVSDASR